MNRLIKHLLPCFVFITLSFVSCGRTDYKAIDKKFEAEGVYADFTDQEYNAMLDYVEKNIEKTLAIAQSRDYVENEEDMDKAWKELEPVLYYMGSLSVAAEEGKLDTNNVKRYKRLQSKINDLLSQSELMVTE